MKILITTDYYLPEVNGVVTSVLNLERELTKRGHEVRILTLSPNRETHYKDEVIFLGSISAKLVYPGARIRMTSSKVALEEMLNWKPDVVHSQCEFSTFVLAKKIAKKLSVPLLHTYHTVYEDYTHYFSPNKKWGERIVSFLSRYIANKCDYMIAPTSKVEKILKGYNVSCPIKVIPSGIDLDQYKQELNIEEKKRLKEGLNIPEDKRIGIFVGRIAKEKNLIEIIELWRKVSSEKAVFLIVGDGPYIDEVKKLVTDYDMDDKVRFAGMVSPEDVWKYYQLGDFFLSASNSETQGLTYIEAIASGLPLLCKADECLNDVIEVGVNGWQYYDSEDFYEKLELLLSDKYSEMFDKSKLAESVDKFSIERFVESMKELYLECLKGKKANE